VYPALAVLNALKTEAPETLWVGSEGGMEADLISRAGLPYRAIPAAGVHGVGLRTLPGNLWRLARGFFAARQVLSEFRPDVLLYTGGYVAVPMALAAWGRPSVLIVPDIEPGMALKALSLFAQKIALAADDSRAYFGGKKNLVVTGYPVRPELAGWTRESARAALKLDSERPVLLVAGGSKGARSINTALLAALPGLLPGVQVVHLVGKLDWPQVEAFQANLPPAMAEAYRPFAYLHEMGQALAAADLAVMRAGASTLGELPQFGLPAVLAPYPYAWRYQKVNAAYLEDHGAALMVRDEELPEKLLPTLTALLKDAPRLAAMRQAMLSLARPGAAQAVAGLIVDCAEGKG